MPATFPIGLGAGAGLAYVLGALARCSAPTSRRWRSRPGRSSQPSVVTLGLSSLIAARTAEPMPRRMLVRTLVVGALALAVSYVAGELLL